MTTPQPLSAADLLVALVDGGVDFLVVGGVAVQAHGHPRTTKDLDVLVRRSPENYERLAGVLDHLGVDDTAQELTGFQTLDSGAAEFDAMNARALVLPFRGREVRTVGLDDLLAMKRAAGREQDRRVDARQRPLIRPKARGQAPARLRSRRPWLASAGLASASRPR